MLFSLIVLFAPIVIGCSNYDFGIGFLTATIKLLYLQPCFRFEREGVDSRIELK